MPATMVRFKRTSYITRFQNGDAEKPRVPFPVALGRNRQEATLEVDQQF